VFPRASTISVVAHRLGPVGLVLGQRREAEQRVGDIVRSLRRQEIAVVRATESLDQRNPHSAVLFEVGDLVRIDHVWIVIMEASSFRCGRLTIVECVAADVYMQIGVARILDGLFEAARLGEGRPADDAHRVRWERWERIVAGPKLVDCVG